MENISFTAIRQNWIDHQNGTAMLQQALPNLMQNNPGSTIYYSAQLGFAWILPTTAADESCR